MAQRYSLGKINGVSKTKGRKASGEKGKGEVGK